MTKDKMLHDIIKNLADNFYDADKQILRDILEEVVANALFISNRSDDEDNLLVLSYEIKNCVKSMYLQRGTEDVKSISMSGVNSTFKNPIEEMRDAIIRNGKRILF